MNESQQLVVFMLDDQEYALRLSVVQRVVFVVEIAPLPKAPFIVLGVVNVHGKIVPVMNTRKRFGLPERDLKLTDQLIIANTARRTVALLVDRVLEVIDRSEQQIVSGESVLPHLEYLEGVAKLEDGIVFLHDLERFLSLEEESMLDEVL